MALLRSLTKYTEIKWTYHKQYNLTPTGHRATMKQNNNLTDVFGQQKTQDRHVVVRLQTGVTPGRNLTYNLICKKFIYT